DFDAMTAANHAFTQAISRGDAEAAMRSDDHFHGVAVQGSRNEGIQHVLEQGTPVLRGLEYLRFSALSGRESIEQHKKNVRLCRKR
ncbi:FCD domain-containing protein, partial [Mycolicibacterium goodii]|uniref:FCD domain-containing protein n=1 Tax=Mycolicibacterium goodii TaxID=134601 RepID=UPI001BDC1211